VARPTSNTDVFVRDNSDDNIFFTAAVNEGLAKYCHGPGIDYVLVLDRDAYLQPDAIERLVDYMDGDPTCGIASPIQVGAGYSHGFMGWQFAGVSQWGSSRRIRSKLIESRFQPIGQMAQS